MWDKTQIDSQSIKSTQIDSEKDKKKNIEKLINQSIIQSAGRL